MEGREYSRPVMAHVRGAGGNIYASMEGREYSRPVKPNGGDSIKDDLASMEGREYSRPVRKRERERMTWRTASMEGREYSRPVRSRFLGLLTCMIAAQNEWCRKLWLPKEGFFFCQVAFRLAYQGYERSLGLVVAT